MSPELQGLLGTILTALAGLMGWDRLRVGKKLKDHDGQRERQKEIERWATAAAGELKQCRADRQADAAARAEQTKTISALENRVQILERVRVELLQEIHDLHAQVDAMHPALVATARGPHRRRAVETPPSE